MSRPALSTRNHLNFISIRCWSGLRHSGPLTGYHHLRYARDSQNKQPGGNDHVASARLIYRQIKDLSNHYLFVADEVYSGRKPCNLLLGQISEQQNAIQIVDIHLGNFLRYNILDSGKSRQRAFRQQAATVGGLGRDHAAALSDHRDIALAVNRRDTFISAAPYDGLVCGIGRQYGGCQLERIAFDRCLDISVERYRFRQHRIYVEIYRRRTR